MSYLDQSPEVAARFAKLKARPVVLDVQNQQGLGILSRHNVSVSYACARGWSAGVCKTSTNSY